MLVSIGDRMAGAWRYAGKTSTARALSRHYDVPVMTIDDVIVASLATGSVSGARARQLCAEAARRLRGGDELTDERQLLSVDTISTHTHGTVACSASKYASK